MEDDKVQPIDNGRRPQHRDVEASLQSRSSASNIVTVKDAPITTSPWSYRVPYDITTFNYNTLQIRVTNCSNERLHDM